MYHAFKSSRGSSFEVTYSRLRWWRSWDSPTGSQYRTNQQMAFSFTQTAFFKIHIKPMPSDSSITPIWAKLCGIPQIWVNPQIWVISESDHPVITQNRGKSRLDHPELSASPIFEGGHLPDYINGHFWQTPTERVITVDVGSALDPIARILMLARCPHFVCEVQSFWVWYMYIYGCFSFLPPNVWHCGKISKIDWSEIFLWIQVINNVLGNDNIYHP